MFKDGNVIRFRIGTDRNERGFFRYPESLIVDSKMQPALKSGRAAFFLHDSRKGGVMTRLVFFTLLLISVIPACYCARSQARRLQPANPCEQLCSD